MKERFKNKLFLLALAGLIYVLLGEMGIKIEESTFKVIVDCVVFIVLGMGIYTSFEKFDQYGNKK